MRRKKQGVVEIELTQAQKDALVPLIEIAAQSYRDDKPIMVLGQVMSDLETAVFGTLTPEQSKAVWLIMDPKRAELKKTGKALAEV